ncbi:MAG: hypothetical protein ACJ8KU_04945 [Chthoniobacterales bacterium]
MTRSRLAVVFILGLVIVAIVVVTLAPVAMAMVIKMSIAGVARQQGLAVEIRTVDAPLLRPVVLHDLHLRSLGDNSVDLEITRVEADLRLAAYQSSSGKRLLRTLRVDDLRGRIDLSGRRAVGAKREWQPWQRLLPDQFVVTAPDLVVRTREIEKRFRNAAISGNELEAGSFRATEIAIKTPWFAKTFYDLHGASFWQENRLTIGAISLMRGLDLDVLTFDLSDLAEDKVGVELAFDLFGGKLRATVTAQNEGGERTWDVAGNAVEVSLGGMSDALEFSNRASGSIHACKFTFRGKGNDLANATASIWTEVTGLTWRDRTAEIVMLGASLYSRQVDIEQLYVKQRRNELTLSGESALPRGGELPDFRGDISAAIGDVSDFARLLGWNPSDFAGEIAVSGTVAERQHALSGELSASGNSLKMFAASVDTLNARMTLNGAELQLQRCELRRATPSPQAITCHGTVDFSDTNEVSAQLVFEQPLALITDMSCCVAALRFADAPPFPGTKPARVSSIRLSGPLLRTGWTLQLPLDQAEVTLPFCDANSGEGETLTIAPLPNG